MTILSSIANCEKQRIANCSVAPASIPYKKITEENLAQAIKVVMGDKVMRSKAQQLGEKIRALDGVASAVEAFHRHLGLIM